MTSLIYPVRLLRSWTKISTIPSNTIYRVVLYISQILL